VKEAVRLPQWGMGMTEGVILEWFKPPGSAVTEDEPIALVEAAKIETELEAPYTGTLTEIVVQPGQTVEVGTVLAWIETTE
jgi:pyruvate/2-oxoglutarate dehydrogenase complex dihydrolipoamide acyltransferase (E2) component